MKQKLRKYFGFTLVELLFVTVILGMIVPSMIQIYSLMIKSNKEFNLRQTAVQQGYEFFERLNVMMQDYTIDYEEYFNRQMVGCVKTSEGKYLTGTAFKWNIGTDGYCTEFTAYGNENSTQSKKIDFSPMPPEYHDIYNCSSTQEANPRGLHRTIGSDCGKFGSKQSFGQYAALFIDVGDIYNTDDDQDLGKPVNNNVNAIVDADNIQELYLISHDGKRRLYFRRKFIAQEGDSVQYKIQILRLRGFDAGQKHNFASIDNEGLYDGQIDTWACDTSMGFEPKNKNKDNCTKPADDGNSVCGAYSQYYLPEDENDCRVDLTYGNTSIYTWNLSISPLNDPDLYWITDWNVTDRQINPYMKILVVNNLYLPSIYSGSSINSFNVPIETTINMKDFYKE